MIPDEDIVNVRMYKHGEEETALVGKGKVVVIERNLFVNILRRAFPDMKVEDEV